MTEQVICVDEQDREVGVAEKLEAHTRGLRHRAFSVVLFDAAGRLLLQQRASLKYHSPSLWTNSCCGHPRPGEPTAAAAARRLREEMGIVCALHPAGTFAYRAELPNGLVEHEVDHVFVGTWDGTPSPDAAEVSAWRWAEIQALRDELGRSPDRFTPWLAAVIDRATSHRSARSALPGQERSPAPG